MRLRPDRRAGVVLVLVLGFVLIMTWISLAVIDGARKELALRASPSAEAQLRQTAYQLLELSIGVLAEVKRFEGELYSPTQGWGYPLSYAGLEDSRTLLRASPRDRSSEGKDAAGEGAQAANGTDAVFDFETTVTAGSLLDELLTETDSSKDGVDGFARAITEITPGGNMIDAGDEIRALALPNGIQAQVRLYDESGKLSLTTTTPERWLLFFQELGFQEAESRRLTDSLLDWMDADDEAREQGAETSDTYSQKEPPYRAANRPLRDFAELRMIEGFNKLFFDEQGNPLPYFRTFQQNVSLYHTGEVNLNTASEYVLDTLAEEKGFYSQNILDFLSGNDRVFGTADDRILRPGLDEDDLPKDQDGNPINVSEPVRFLRVAIAVSSGQSVYHLNSILDLAQAHPGGVYPFRIVRILENQPLP